MQPNMSDELEEAIRGGDVAEMVKLLTPLTALQSVDHQRNTPLHIAAYYHRDEAVEYLLSKGAALEAANDEGQTPLHMALTLPGGTSTAAVLLKTGANANARNQQMATPLHVAALHGDGMGVQLLLRLPVDRTLRTLDGKTAVDVAQEAGNAVAITLLAK